MSTQNRMISYDFLIFDHDTAYHFNIIPRILIKVNNQTSYKINSRHSTNRKLLDLDAQLS